MRDLIRSGDLLSRLLLAFTVGLFLSCSARVSETQSWGPVVGTYQ
ncbi:MAG TPA: hypothetical protein VNA89_01160 [Gemmatimonadaceae bacterium]|nr:hypothetical protein [Gemmatimonadaceae bacterium]